MSRAKNAVTSTTTFVARHRVAIAVTATAVTTAVIVRKTMGAQLDFAMDFIKENDMLDKFNATFSDEI